MLRRIRLVACCRTLCVLGGAFALAGCFQSGDTNPYLIDRVYTDISVKANRNAVEAKTAGLLTNPAPVFADHSGSQTTNDADMPLQNAHDGETDFLIKADVFWKLDWLCQHMKDLDLPSDYEAAIAKAKRALKNAFPDMLFDLAEKGTAAIEESLEHHKAEEKLMLAGVKTSLVPWGEGEYALQQFIDEGGLGFGGKPTQKYEASADHENAVSSYTEPAPLLTPEQEETIRLLKHYVVERHTHPEACKRKAWDLAELKADALLAGLLRRPENANHPGLNRAKTRSLLPNTDTLNLPIPMPGRGKRVRVAPIMPKSDAVR